MSEPHMSSTPIDKTPGPGPLLELTGAGASTERGLTTFRGPGGRWESRKPAEPALEPPA